MKTNPLDVDAPDYGVVLNGAPIPFSVIAFDADQSADTIRSVVGYPGFSSYDCIALVDAETHVTLDMWVNDEYLYLGADLINPHASFVRSSFQPRWEGQPLIRGAVLILMADDQGASMGLPSAMVSRLLGITMAFDRLLRVQIAKERVGDIDQLARRRLEQGLSE